MALLAEPMQCNRQHQFPSTSQEEEDSLEVALALSREDARAEEGDDEALLQAIAASLAEDEAQLLALGLPDRATVEPLHYDAWPTETGTLVAQATAPPLPHAARLIESTLKVAFNNDMRRVPTSWESDSDAATILFIVKNAVEDCFGITVCSEPPYNFVLKYKDDEGDLCSLVEETLEDFLHQGAGGKALKINVERATVPTGLCDALEEVLPPAVVMGHALEIDASAGHNDGAEEEEGQMDRAAVSQQDFSIATPPSTPRPGFTIEDDYDAVWSMVEAGPVDNRDE